MFCGNECLELVLLAWLRDHGSEGGVVLTPFLGRRAPHTSVGMNTTHSRRTGIWDEDNRRARVVQAADKGGGR